MITGKTYQMNDDHRPDCPCYQCFKIGDKVLVYLNDYDKVEEIVTKVSRIRDRTNSYSIGVVWPNWRDGEENENWWVRPESGWSKDDCIGTGKIIRKVTE